VPTDPNYRDNTLIMDLSDIGIITTPTSYAVRAEDDSMECAGIKSGDVVLMEKRELNASDIVAVLVNGRTDFQRVASDSEGEVAVVAVGLIRKL
jgi:SOS-response transcriptional repressor LexA